MNVRLNVSGKKILWCDESKFSFFGSNCISASGVGIVWNYVGNSLIFQHDNDPQHTANVGKTYLDRETHNGALSQGLASTEPEPQHY